MHELLGVRELWVTVPNLGRDASTFTRRGLRAGTCGLFAVAEGVLQHVAFYHALVTKLFKQ